MFAALPGLRELRSALVGGYLWIIFLWLILDPSIGEGSFDAEPYQSARHFGEEVGPVALGVALTFAAYLIGICANEMRDLLARSYLSARRSTVVTPGRINRNAILAKLRGREQSDRAQLPAAALTSLGDLFRPIFDLVRESQREWTKATSEFTTQFKVLGGTVFRGISMLFSDLAAVLALPFAITWELSESLIGAISALLKELGADPYRPYLSPRGVRALQRYLNEAIPEPYRDGSPTVADVIADFDVVRTRLIDKSPETVAEVDRLYAEADLRSAIVPPLIFIVGLFAFEVSLWWLIATLPLLALRMTSRTKRHEAADLMADALVRDVVRAPSIEIHLAR